MTSLTPLLEQFKINVKFQQTPIPYVDDDYTTLLLQGVKRLYIDEGIEDNFISDYDENLETLTRDLKLTEQEYIVIASEIAFLNQIKADVAQLVSYSTDAMSISNATKPFEHISQSIIELENRLSQLAWKFTHRTV